VANEVTLRLKMSPKKAQLVSELPRWRSAVRWPQRLKKKDYGSAVSDLVETLLAVRNARVHASNRIPSKLPAGGKAGSVERERKKASDERSLASIRRHDYEVHTVAEIVLAIGKIVIATKTKQPFDYIEQLVDSRTAQIRRQIAEKVRAWPQAGR
jgi:hypothetical protein